MLLFGIGLLLAGGATVFAWRMRMLRSASRQVGKAPYIPAVCATSMSAPTITICALLPTHATVTSGFGRVTAQ